MPRPRFTIRWMMVTVVLLAAAFSIAVQIWMANQPLPSQNPYSEKAERHRLTIENTLLPQIEDLKARKARYQDGSNPLNARLSPEKLRGAIAEVDALIDGFEREVRDHRKMQLMYEAAVHDPRALDEPALPGSPVSRGPK
jgi:hypothetical protein